MKKLILFLSVLLAGLFSCSKNSVTAKDTEPPIIILNTPAINQIFTAGQPINISGNITDNNHIAEVHIHVSNSNTSTLLMDVHLYPGSNSTSFNQSITAVAGINYKILVTAKDKAINEGRSSVEVYAN